MGTTALSSAFAPQLIASNSTSHVRRSSPAVHRHSGLRILRAFEPGVCPDNAGRMVISGTMADVCAELDRLTRIHATTH